MSICIFKHFSQTLTTVLWELRVRFKMNIHCTHFLPVTDVSISSLPSWLLSSLLQVIQKLYYVSVILQKASCSHPHSEHLRCDLDTPLHTHLVCTCLPPAQSTQFPCSSLQFGSGCLLVLALQGQCLSDKPWVCLCFLSPYKLAFLSPCLPGLSFASAVPCSHAFLVRISQKQALA